MKTANKVFKYVWLTIGLAAVASALFGAYHQLFSALMCFLFYLATLADIRREEAKEKKNSRPTSVREQ